MLVQLTSLDPIWSLFTIIGILTLFGKRKKDEKDHEETGESSTPMPTSAPNSPAAPLQAPPVPASAPSSPSLPTSPMNANVSYQPPRSWQGPPQGDEDSSLSRLLQSLLRDLPSDANSMGGDQTGAFSLQSTAEWVPPRATPTSRPMMIGPGGKKGPEPDKPIAAPQPPAASAPPPPSAPPVRSVKPSALMEQMKKIGADPSEAESQYRFLLVDGFSSQSDSFSFEPYYVEKPFDFDSIQDALVKNSSMFIGEKTKILFDSIDQVVAKIGSKDFVKRLSETLDKLRDSNVTLVLTVDLSKAPKDVVKWLEDTASCVIDLDKDESDPNGRELKVRKLNGSASKIDTEIFEIDSSKGLVFVK